MDARPFAIHPGDATSPVVLHVPHAATRIPPDARESILLDDVALEAELRAMTDAHTDRIALAAVHGLDPRPWVFVNQLSRLVVDPERFTDEREEMRAVGMGAVYTATSQRQPLRPVDPARDEALVDRYFRPYANALADLVAARLAACGRVTIVDVHSYPRTALPYERHSDLVRPEVCLGVDAFHTRAELVAAARAAFGTVGRTAVNAPFIGTYVPTRFFGREPRAQSIMVEVRRDAYVDGRGITPGLDRIVTALRGLLQTVP